MTFPGSGKGLSTKKELRGSSFVNYSEYISPRANASLTQYILMLPLIFKDYKLNLATSQKLQPYLLTLLAFPESAEVSIVV
ncbi:hypothetical protein J3R73_002446 [Labrys monachus]|uniref:Uncharacterized protein n=1 Tax=Labrys monachus TaxID=217067 RepID=A0ABU0FET4_9HYPH|nr:hypothetical protein [Labrys monachus]